MPHANVDLASIPAARARIRRGGRIVKIETTTLKQLLDAFDAMPRILDHLDGGNVEAARDLAREHVSDGADY